MEEQERRKNDRFHKIMAELDPNWTAPSDGEGGSLIAEGDGDPEQELIEAGDHITERIIIREDGIARSFKDLDAQ